MRGIAWLAGGTIALALVIWAGTHRLSAVLAGAIPWAFVMTILIATRKREP